MSENAAHAIERLEMEGATGCLLVDGPGGAEARIYVVAGEVVHAEGPAGEGEAALTQALGWWEATTSFDANAPAPAKTTVDMSVEELPELPEAWPDEELREEEKRFGFENTITSGQALFVLLGLVVVVIAAVLILSRKY